MIVFLLKRLGGTLVVMLAVTAIAFVMFNYLGDPVVAILGQDASESARRAVEQQLGLDRPITVRFLSYLADVLRGDFGLSYRLGQPVMDVIVDRLPATIELAFSGMGIALLIGVPCGVYSAIQRNSAGTRVLLGASLVGISVPTFFVGVVLIWVFSVTLGVLPSFGRGQTVDLGWWTTGFLTPSGLAALVLPATSIAVFQIAMIMRLVRAEMLEVIRSDYVQFARARGLPESRIYFRHALKNTLIPVITIIALQLGSLIAFAVITESVFQWPGLGLLFLQSVAAADVTIMSAYLILIAGLFVVINLAVDLLYFAIDPRLRARAGR
ncbi:ABC transporter permease [Jannaschia formosa]|uniref:ABC transporter permease n=1 Tax=Jannaschia formosa TaxID=2259592 RepID=UPI000E1B7D37|nr:ABC transporter permease [Jannaschia formosa]TFL16168.1 ABC transporter permease [Jannaschia formosa]